MATWNEDILQAFRNLGGQAHLKQIYAEIKQIRKEPLPKSLEHIVQRIIQDHSSDSASFRGNNLFRKVGNGVWALREQAVIIQPPNPTAERNKPSFNNYLPPTSFEQISSVLRTIKEYRDYQQLDSPSWKEYVNEFFHILGFSTQEKNPRLMVLNVMGSNHTPLAVVGFALPGENLEEIVPGLPWESYLFFAAHYYQVEWGILTSGLALKILNFQDGDIITTNHWPDLDRIICDEKLDTFWAIYKVLSRIKNHPDKSVTGRGKGQNTRHVPSKDGLAERHVRHLEFWGQLLEKAKNKTKIHAKVSPGKENWISAGAGKTGLYFNYVVCTEYSRVELYIDRGEAEWNKRVFINLLQRKVEIEEVFGNPLDWELLPNKRASCIRFVVSNYGLRDDDHWDELQDQMIDAMIRFEKAFRPFILLIQ